MTELLGLLVLAFSIGLDNFAASIAIGLTGIKKKDRIKIAIVFGSFETLMPIIGLIIGKQVVGVLGDHTNLIGGSILILAGAYNFISTFFNEENKTAEVATKGGYKLFLAGLGISIDNLIIGFGLGAYNRPIVLTSIVIAFASISLAFLGLELGSRLGEKVENYAEKLSGIILIIVGIAIATKLI